MGIGMCMWYSVVGMVVVVVVVVVVGCGYCGLLCCGEEREKESEWKQLKMNSVGRDVKIKK